jgi:hypothetical protein
VNIGDVLTLIGDLAALAAAAFAFLALGKANTTISEARALREATQAAATDAARDRREAAAEARAERQEAQQAAHEAAAERRAATEAARAERFEAEKQHLVRRVERVGELVEELFWKAVYNQNVQPEWSKGAVAGLEVATFLDPRNRLSQALVGLRDRLPRCVALVEQAKMPEQAVGLARQARNEVETELKYLHGELTRPS